VIPTADLDVVAPPPLAVRTRSYGTWARTLLRKGGLLAALGLLVLLFTAFYPQFLSTGNAINILLGASVTAMLAMGQTFVICTAGIDLSVGSTASLAGIAGALLITQGTPVWPAVVLAILVGGAAGVVNGLLIVITKVTPFMVTLGTMSVFSGFALVLSGGRPIYGLPTSFTGPLSNRLAGIPAPVWIMVGLAVFLTLVMRSTAIGEYAIAIGGNEEAARLSGVRIGAYKVAVYAISGLLAGVAGVIIAARLGTADPTAGADLLLPCIAAAVMGGASLLGGEGSIPGAALGAVVIITLQTGLTLLGVTVFYQIIAVGAVIILAVALDQLTRRGRAGAGQ
jgi:ribose transport system permease protein